MSRLVPLAWCLAAAALAAAVPAGAQNEPMESTWVTLGTRGGPVASPIRAQPANLLRAGQRLYLVDAGDGAAGQLAKLNITTAQIDGVFISHLHFDHTAGLAGLLGLRWQTNAAGPLRIWGPPGTKETVDGLIASMKPGTTAGYGVPGGVGPDLAAMVVVTEVRDRVSFQVDGFTVTARSNAHYSFEPGSNLAQRFESLAFRFDLPGRSIAFTGDTGPSTAVNELAAGADLLVAEMMDVDHTIALVRRNSPDMPPQATATMERHLKDHHLLPTDVGEMAAAARVGAVVVTHFVGQERDHSEHLDYLRQIATHYPGPVVLANDLDEF